MPNNDNYEYMKFLDLTGAQQIWNTAKQTFVQTVNGVGIDANGNVQLNAGVDVQANVSLSGNEAELTSLLVDTTRYKVGGNSTHIFTCGANDNLYTKINQARTYPNSILYVEGVHNLVSEMSGNYGNGIKLDNNIHIIFSSNAKATFHYTGNDTSFMQSFSVFNSSTENDAGYTLENVVIECSRIRYAVHDDIGSYTKPYIVRFKNCNFKIDNTDTSYLTDFHQCIGGGCGAYETVEIINCVFNSVGISSTAYTSDNHAEVSYHNTGLSYGKSTIYVENCYFTEGGFLITNYGTSTDITTAYVNNCSFKYRAWCNNYVDYTSNVNLVEYNNKTRETLLWQNQNPFTSFTELDNAVSLASLTPYNYIKVLFKYHYSHTSMAMNKCFFDLTNFNMNCNLFYGFADDTFSRAIIGNANGIKISYAYTPSAGRVDERIIPIAIYGGYISDKSEL